MGGRGSLAGTFVGVLIFSLLSDILQLQNIDSNVQLVMKGLIIVCTVLVQEQNLGQLIARWRFSRSPEAGADPKTAESNRPPSAATAQFAREDLHEAS
jgi:simple sugar transport system permease protein